jgi:hypothetical protein
MGFHSAFKGINSRRIYNHRLAEAIGIVECEYGIRCNKWRILHRAIDACSDSLDVLDKTCCITHKFFRQRDGFHYQHPLYEPTSRVGNRNVTGTTVPFAHTPQYHIAKFQTRVSLNTICLGYSSTWYKFVP